MTQRHHAVCDRPEAVAVARANGGELARTSSPVVLREFGARDYPPVVYFPPSDVDMTLLTRSAKKTTCPIKGVASYYRLAADGNGGPEIAWCYEDPMAGVEAVRGHLAFYTDRVDVKIGD